MSLGSGKKQASNDTQATGIMKRVGRMLGIGRSQINVGEVFYPSRNPNNGNGGQADAPADEEEGIDLGGRTGVGNSENDNGGNDGANGEEEEALRPDYRTPPAYRKRDIYDFSQAHPQEVVEGGEIEEPVRKRAKLSRTSKKAKPPLVFPKAPIATQRQTRANRKAASREPEADMNPPTSSPAGTNGAAKGLEPPKRRGRGRPPKNLPVVPEPSSDFPDLQDIGAPRTPSVEYPGDDAPESMVAENGVSDILMNPSPVKPIPADPPRTQRSKRAEQLQNPQTRSTNGDTADRERKRAAEEEREYEEKRRQRREIYRMQQEVIDAKLRHPLYGPYLQAEIDREAAKVQEKRMQMKAAKASQSRHFRNSKSSSVQEAHDYDDGEGMEEEPFDDRYERIKVFPNNNASKYRGPKPLSREERLTFIDIMHYAKSMCPPLHLMLGCMANSDVEEVRYEKAARRFGRSLEEIFAFAKELQDSFDLAHEKGEMNLPCDEWTYDIFIEQP
jgi:hypothetical protein